MYGMHSLILLSDDDNDDNDEKMIKKWDGSGYIAEGQIYNAIKTTCIIYNTL